MGLSEDGIKVADKKVMVGVIRVINSKDVRIDNFDITICQDIRTSHFISLIL